MKKLLIAICGIFLLAAPIQMASDRTSNNSEETLVKPNTIEQALNNLTYKNILMSNKWTADINDLEVLSKQDQNNVASTKVTQTEAKVTSTKPTTSSQTEDKVAVAKIAPSTQTESKVTSTKPTTPQQSEDKVTSTKPTTPQQSEDNVTSTKPTPPPQTEDKETPTQPTPPTTPSDQVPPTTSPSDVSAFEQQVVELTNAERTKAGLAPLQIDSKLMAAAREKSQDMQTNNYFSHTSPTFGSPFDRLTALGISYKAAGENIAQGQRTPQEVVQGWMNSSGHRANILNANFTHIGVGYVKTGNYWTQQFIQK